MLPADRTIEKCPGKAVHHILNSINIYPEDPYNQTSVFLFLTASPPTSSNSRFGRHFRHLLYKYLILCWDKLIHKDKATERKLHETQVEKL